MTTPLSEIGSDQFIHSALRNSSEQLKMAQIDGTPAGELSGHGDLNDVETKPKECTVSKDCLDTKTLLET